MLDEQERFYIVVIGDVEDWATDRGSVCCIEDKNGERAMPVFTTPEKAESFLQAHLQGHQSHMEMLETIPVSHVSPLTEGRFAVSSMDVLGVARMAVQADMDYLVRDPRPGAQQEVIRLDT